MEDLSDGVVITLVALVMFLAPALVLALPVGFFGRKRAGFTRLDFGILLVPFAIWIVFFFVSTGKSIGNIIEAPILGFVVPIAVVIRVIVGKTISPRACAISLLVFACGFALMLGAIFPKIEF